MVLKEPIEKHQELNLPQEYEINVSVPSVHAKGSTTEEGHTN